MEPPDGPHCLVHGGVQYHGVSEMLEVSLIWFLNARLLSLAYRDSAAGIQMPTFSMPVFTPRGQCVEVWLLT